MVPQGDCGILTLPLHGEAGQLEGDMNALTDNGDSLQIVLKELLEKNGTIRMDG